MKEENIDLKNYKLHIINYDKFKTVGTYFVFSSFFNMEEQIYLSLLSKVLISSCKKYNTNKKLMVKLEELYNSSLSSTFSCMGNTLKLSFTYDFINPKYLNIDIKENLDFLVELVFNPNILFNKFDKKTFELSKEKLITSLTSIRENSNSYGFVKFSELLYDGVNTKKNLYNYIDKIKNITSEELCKFYKRIIRDYKFDIFVIGDVNNDEYIKYFKNKLKGYKNNFNKELSFDVEDNINKEIMKEDSSDFDTTNLFVGYTFNDLTKYEEDYVMFMYCNILGGINNNVLFDNIREKNSLCYSIASFIRRYPIRLWIETEISVKNLNKTIKLIDECINKMGKKETISPLLKGAKEAIITSINMYYEDKNLIIDNVYKKEFMDVTDIEEKIKIYKNITEEDIINLNKKISKYITYVLKEKEK